VAEVTEAVRAHWRASARPKTYGGDTSHHVIAFAAPKGLAFVVYHGAMDCPSGCVVKEYWYYGTDGSCAPALVGYHAIDPVRFAACRGMDVVGRPMWGLPEVEVEPYGACNPATRPAKLSGTYRLRAVGRRVPCLGAETAGAEARALDLVVTIEVKQGWWLWRDEGKVVVRGTGEPRIDGQPLRASFARGRVEAVGGDERPRSPCERRHRIGLSVDLDHDAPGRLSLSEDSVRTCESSPPCLGDLELSLTRR
jgi:hypothetical protein